MMYPVCDECYTPMVHREEQLEMDIEELELPYANEKDTEESDKLEVYEIVEENIEADDPYHIVNTEFNAEKNSEYSLVSMTKRPNNSEKVKV